MAGGIWTTQNKVRPGVYVNFASEPASLGTMGERGIAAYPAELAWGQPGLTVLEAATYLEQALPLLGYKAGDARIAQITSAMAHASRVLIYRLGGADADKAEVTEGNLTVTAKWGGLRGNALTVAIQPDVDEEELFQVITYLEGEEVDRQQAATIADLVSNAYVDFSGTGELAATAGVNLAGGTAGTSSGGDYTDALAALEAEEWNVLGLSSTDAPTQQLVTAYIARLRNEGKKVTAVLVGYPEADHEGITSLRNGVLTTDGQVVTPGTLVWRIAAMAAAAEVNQSLTYTAIPGAKEAYPKLTHAETEQALRNGELVLTTANGAALIEQDINTLTSFTPDKNRPFGKNRVVRVLDAINNDLKRIFSTFYLGKVGNDADGRSLLRSEMVGYLETLQGIGAIQNFDPQADLSVEMGGASDSVYVEVAVQPVDAIEKIYMKVTVR